jgi:single-strand DNA-binding protein
MYQNKVTLIGFLGSNAQVRNNGSFTALSLATKSSYKKNGGVYLAHGMAPLRCIRQALGVCQNAH